MQNLNEYASSLGVNIYECCLQGTLDPELFGLSKATREAIKDPSKAERFFALGSMTLEEARPFLVKQASQNLDHLIRYLKHKLISPESVIHVINEQVASNPITMLYFFECGALKASDFEGPIHVLAEKRPELLPTLLKKGWITEQFAKKVALAVIGQDNFTASIFIELGIVSLDDLAW